MDDKFYAMKVLQIAANTSEKDKQCALAEVRYLASVEHPNVISYKAAFIDAATSSICLVMEYADGGDL
jgi:NIMA (never in mitosis gene a)-related kinase 1/4/5